MQCLIRLLGVDRDGERSLVASGEFLAKPSGCQELELCAEDGKGDGYRVQL